MEVKLKTSQASSEIFENNTAVEQLIWHAYLREWDRIQQTKENQCQNCPDFETIMLARQASNGADGDFRNLQVVPCLL